MRKYLSANVRARGYNVTTAEDGTEALQLLAERSFDLLILDIMMPGPDGLALLQAVRSNSNVPVLMLSARGREADKVQALDLGADDYLTKPFGVEELLARLRAALRRAENSSRASMTTYRRGDLEVDFDARHARRQGAQVPLTHKEYEVLAYLARNAGKVLTHRQILHAVWGGQYGDEADYVWTYVRRLRRKLEPQPQTPRYLLTEPGVGYQMSAPDSSQGPAKPAPSCTELARATG
jgi:two-component system, OmpR family, KDP operon response regulator KdpE